MSKQFSQHAEWLSLIEVSGPFLAEPVLKSAFPQGLEKIDPLKKKQFRQTYDEWRETIDSHNAEDLEIKEKIHQEWINWVIKFGLEWDEDEDGDILKYGDAIPESIQLNIAEHNITLKPEFAVYANAGKKPYLLLSSYPASTKLDEVIKGSAWSTTPAERMAQLCRGVGTRLGIITNGEQWLFIDAPEGGITTYASWYARLWSQEPVTLQAFYSLLNIGTIFNGFEGSQKLTELLDVSLKHQDEVTETLGAQVSRAVEVLIQSLDRINNDHNGKLLEGVEPTELYEAGLTLMMRLVFLLCAEERGLLLLGDETYESHYALSTLRLKLREEAGLHGEEVLSYRKNAWARLLAVFRAVYGGIEHENMRMPALGGSLFDPDRFAFLEGRAKGSNWKVEEAKPLPIDNRTVLLFLDAIQLYQGRTLSYRALDVEQIGYVYEGLLEKTVIRASDVTLELNGSKSAKTPWVELKELASAGLDGEDNVKKLLKERTKSSAGRINSDLNKDLSDVQLDKLLGACQNDAELRDRVKPYYHFLRVDAWGSPLLYPKDAFMVTTGTDRQETGTHYTPKSLTESIVKETLEPIVYIGPAEGEPREKWKLKSSEELLDLKVCDLAMGSGAFLVQVCRWLGERVCEAWLQEEQGGKVISAEGDLLNEKSEELLPVDAEERFVIAKRLIAERCIYGVDINPLAVELAKLSIWLVTLSRGRPFGFLDHNLKYGDSLLGLHDLNQLYYLDMKPTRLSEGGGCATQFFTQQIEEFVSEALSIRKELRERPIRDIHDVEIMTHLDEQVKEKLDLSGLLADAFLGKVLKSGGKSVDTAILSIEAGLAFQNDENMIDSLKKRAKDGFSSDLPKGKKLIESFNWCLEFPEVFNSGGFDAVVGNPPYFHGSRISTVYGEDYQKYICQVNDVLGKSDLCVHFLKRAFLLIKSNGYFGFLVTNSISEGANLESGLAKLCDQGATIYQAEKDISWSGKASVYVTRIHLTKNTFLGEIILNNKVEENISVRLSRGLNIEPSSITENKVNCFKGCELLGDFYIGDAEAIRLQEEGAIRPILGGKELTNTGFPGRNVIYFSNLTEEEAKKIYPLSFEFLQDRFTKNTSFPKRKKWWQFHRSKAEMYKKAEKLSRYLIRPYTSNMCWFTWADNDLLVSNSIVAVMYDEEWVFGVLNSTLHEVFSRKYATRMKTDMRYIPSSCFEKYPLPENNSYKKLNEYATELFQERIRVSKDNNLGLTSIYKLYHQGDPILDEMRRIQSSLDGEVLNAYGWSDISNKYGYYETEYGMKYTFSNTVEEEVIKRLVVLSNEYSERKD